MKNIQTTFLILFAIFAFQSYGQEETLIDPVLIRLQGKIISAADSSGVPYANIVNNRTHSGTITNANGNFTLEMLNIDSLVVTSVGFQRGVIKVPHNYNGYTTLVFVILPANYAIGQVDVEGSKTKVDLGFETGKPVDIDPELRGDAFNEAPPILAAFFNPFSYWQYYLSKKEKRKREVRKAMALERNWELHSQNYNKEKVMMLTGLNEMQADTFMIWFNSQEVLPYTSTEYEVRTTIIEYFRYFQIEKVASPNPSAGGEPKDK